MRAPRGPALLALLALAACGAPIRVRPMDSQAVHRTLTENVLTTGEPSVTELVVRSAHSTQSEPATIEEVRRILLLHAARVRETSRCR